MAEAARSRDTLVTVLSRDKRPGGPVSLLRIQGEDGGASTAFPQTRSGASAIPFIGRATRTVRLHFAGEVADFRELVDPIRHQMDIGMTRLLVTIDELSMDAAVGLRALEDVRALCAERSAVIIWSRSPLERFRTPRGVTVARIRETAQRFFPEASTGVPNSGEAARRQGATQQEERVGG
jgi:hypothetical protein